MSKLVVVMVVFLLMGCASHSLRREDVALSNYTAGYLAGLRDASHGSKAVVVFSTTPISTPIP
jgi:hypothetical protein